jgi:hypothetical protein
MHFLTYINVQNRKRTLTPVLVICQGTRIGVDGKADWLCFERCAQNSGQGVLSEKGDGGS